MDLVVALVKYQRENKHSTCWILYKWNHYWRRVAGLLLLDPICHPMKNQRAKNNSTSLTFERNHHYHRVSGLLFMSTILHKVLGCTFYLFSQQPSLCVSNPKAEIHHDAVPTSKSEASTCQCFREGKYRWDTAKQKQVPLAAFMSQNPDDFPQERSCMEWVFFLFMFCCTLFGVSPQLIVWRDCYPHQPEGSHPPTIFVTCGIAPKISWLFPHRAVSPHNLLYKWYSSYGSAIEGRMGEKQLAREWVTVISYWVLEAETTLVLLSV